ncbi:MAG: glycogen synthase GlgA [Gemmatimonadetes bacterium]|nr:glycogen synthase GlgA [Gemmatimonadota bacterium]
MSPQNRKILYVVSEIAPFAKTGGLADVSAALPAHLHRRGHDVRVFVPLYSSIEVDAYDFASVPGLGDVSVQIGTRSYDFSVYQATLTGTDLKIYFVHCPELYDRANLYTSDEDEHRRFVLLTRAALEACQRMQWAPDIAHAHDWQSALLPLYLKTIYAWDRLFQGTGTVLTIHNLGYQGIFPSTVLEDTGLAPAAHYLDAEDLRGGRIGFLKTGLLHADHITTVSPTYAEEIVTERLGMGLGTLLQKRRDVLTGILNGVDTEVWNPREDPHLPFRYSVKSLWRKERCKEALLEELSLPYEKHVPVIGMITRLVSQKGIDLLEKVLPELLERRDFRLVVLASGEKRFETFFQKLQSDHPGKVCFYRGYHEQLAHHIEGGADMFLMPSRYEPCGLNQLYSLIYGTVPIVHRTGGLADTVQLWDPSDQTGTGIVFDHPTPEGVRWAIESALEQHADRKAWQALQKNGMAGDFSWESRIPEYEAVYEEILASKKAVV